VSDVRKAIIATYAEWTAMSALRSGAPIKSRRDVYTALRGVDFGVLFEDALGPINRATFDAWHADAVRAMMKREPRLTVGWAAKIINVYLKTRVYIGAQGRHNLKEIRPSMLACGSGSHGGFRIGPISWSELTVSTGSRTSLTTSATVASLTGVVSLRRR
jgi:hypothetical protein